VPDIWWYESRGCWCADVPQPEENGGRTRLYLGADEREARRKFHEYMASYHAGLPDPQGRSEQVTLYRLAAQFLRWAKTNLSESTYETYKHQLREFVDRHGHEAAAEITPGQVEEQKARIKARTTRARTVNFFVQSIKRLFNWAVEQGLLEDNPIRNVKRIPRDPPRDRTLKPAEVEDFMDYARRRQPLGEFCEVLLYTGMRVGELLSLRWSQIDFERGIARISNHKTAGRGEQRPRVIPLNDRVVEILQQQPRGSDVVFTGDYDQPLTYDAIKCRKDKLERENPDMPHVTFHQFRHTFASRLAEAGVPERVTQAILGHSSKLMTRYYTVTPVHEMLDAVARVGNNTREQTVKR